MKKRLFAFFSAFVLLSMFASCGTVPGDTVTTDENGYREWVADTRFENGVSISRLHSSMPFLPWHFDGQATPVWQLGQYCDLSTTRAGYDATVNDLSLLPDGTEGTHSIIFTDADGYRTLTNLSGSKKLAIDGENETVVLAIDTTKEYIDPATGERLPRREGEDWVHMILQQSLDIPIAECEEVIMACNFKVQQCDVYDTSIGAAQFQWILRIKDCTLQNQPGSAMWFLVSVYDDRYEVYPGLAVADTGKADATQDFMYAPSGTALFGEANANIRVGRPYELTLNLKTHLRKAFDEAYEKGYLNSEAKWENMRITGFNIGWEVSNVAACSVKIAHMSIKTR